MTPSSSSKLSSSSSTSSSSPLHHYAFDAVKLLDDCIDKLQLTIDRDIHCQHIALYDMKQSLINTERILHHHLLHVLEIELYELHQLQGNLFSEYVNIDDARSQTLAMTVQTLNTLLQEKKRLKEEAAASNSSSTTAAEAATTPRMNTATSIPGGSLLTPLPPTTTLNNKNPQESSTSSSSSSSPPQPQHLQINPIQDPHCFYPSRSALDTLLFRLIVALQLCLVRIDDAHLIITGRRLVAKTVPTTSTLAHHHHRGIVGWSPLFTAAAIAGFVTVLGAAGTVGAITVVQSKKGEVGGRFGGRYRNNVKSLIVIPIVSVFHRTFQFLKGDTKVGGNYSNRITNGISCSSIGMKLGLSFVATRWVTRKWNTIWMTDKIVRSTTQIDEWQQQWQSVLSANQVSVAQQQHNHNNIHQNHLQHPQMIQYQAPLKAPPEELLDPKSLRLIEFALKENNQVSKRVCEMQYAKKSYWKECSKLMYFL